MPLITREETHEALDALYDNLALSQARLLAHFPSLASLPDLAERGQRLRAILLEAIETLRPSRRAPFGSRESRACDVLTARYVERLPIPIMMDQLALGRRQVFRDLTQAEEKLAQVLSTWAEGAAPAPELPRSAVDSLSSELAILATQPAPLHLGEVVAEALSLIAPLATKRGVTVAAAPIVSDDLLLADRAILKQLLVQVLSWAIQRAAKGPVKLATSTSESNLAVTVLFSPAGPDEEPQRIAEVQHVAQHDRIDLLIEEAKGICQVTMRLRRSRPVTVLVAEDNPGAVELYRRYLSGGAWDVQHLAEPRLAFEVARRMRPDVVLLDIMMPKMDGWSVLQSLRQHEETRDLPVIVCSVIQDEELSQALGAAACLKKPVSQGDLLAALHRCLAQRRTGG